MRHLSFCAPIVLASTLVAGCTGPETEIRKLTPDLAVVTQSGTPDTVDFGGVVVPYQADQTFQILNAGKADLIIDSIALAGDEGGPYTIDPESITIGKDDSAAIGVHFAPASFLRYDRTIVISSNDPVNPEYELVLLGEGVDGPVPDIALSSGSLDFGTVTAGTEATEFISIRNVGDGPLDIDSIEQTGSGAFSIASGPVSGGQIAANGETALIVSYAPLAETGDSATFTINSNDPDEPAIDLVVVGNGGSEDEYPVAVIDCPGAGEVNPPVRIDLDGTGSYDPNGLEPLSYSWEILSKPFGSATGVNEPYAGFTSLFVDLAGQWELQLKVTNSVGLISAPTRCSFLAESEEQIHVELTWDTNNSDVDLHFIQAGSSFFDQDGDCCYCNRNPNWGSSGGDDDPRLALDNRAGLGPEATKLRNPESGDYLVKVHYYEDKGGGTSTATVKVWLNGGTSPFWQGSKVLTSNQVWDVGVVRWPDAVFVEDFADPYLATRTRCQ